MSTGTTKVLQDADGVVYGTSDAINRNAGPEPTKIPSVEDEAAMNEEEAKKDRNIYKSINASDGGRGGNIVGSVKQSLGKILKNKKLEVCFSATALSFLVLSLAICVMNVCYRWKPADIQYRRVELRRKRESRSLERMWTMEADIDFRHMAWAYGVLIDRCWQGSISKIR